MGPKPPSTFAQQAAGKQPGLALQFLEFLRHNKRWWLTPIVILLLLAGALIVLGGSGLAPFIYTVF